MKQIQQLLIILFLFPITLNAQSPSPIFAPIGAVWRYNASDDNGLGSRHYRYVVTADTVINGWNARILQGEIWNGSAFVPSPVMTRYVSTTADQVYHWVDTSFVLLMDFSAQPGDTIFSAVKGAFPFYNNCYGPPIERVDFYYTIATTGVQEVSGLMLRTQTVIQPYPSSWDWNILGIFEWGKITERIGPNPSGTWFGGSLGCVQEPPASLRCYTDNEIFFEGFTQGLPCDSVVLTQIPGQTVPAIGPNPFSDKILVNIPDGAHLPYQFSLFNTTGQLLTKKEISAGQTAISAENFPEGIYFWEIRKGAILIGSGKLLKNR